MIRKQQQQIVLDCNANATHVNQAQRQVITNEFESMRAAKQVCYDCTPHAYSLQMSPATSTVGKSMGGFGSSGIQFAPIVRVEDTQAVRAVAFHPSGRYFAVGTNSKQLLVCRYPDAKHVRFGEPPRQAENLLTRPKQHRGSVYCVGFNPTGELLASGSNDKTVRLMGFNADNCKTGM
jgi:WD40 repeat protein